MDNKIHIKIFVLCFMFIVISLCSLLCIYYVYPSNFLLFDKSNEYKIIKNIEYIIKPHKQIRIKNNDYTNKLLELISDERLQVLVENKFKSENVLIDNKLILLKNADLVIKNEKDSLLKCNINVYSK
jgi:hypothetical protein